MRVRKATFSCIHFSFDTCVTWKGLVIYSRLFSYACLFSYSYVTFHIEFSRLICVSPEKAPSWRCAALSLPSATSHLWISQIAHMSESWHTYEWVMSHVWMSHVTLVNKSNRTYESCHTYEGAMMASRSTFFALWNVTRVYKSNRTCVCVMRGG